MTKYERSWWLVKEKKHMAFVLITITLILQIHMKGCVGCVETERMGLLELKSYLNSLLSPKEESILNSWSHDDGSIDCCHWERVKCSEAIGGHIVDLSLREIMPYDRSLNLSLLHSFPKLKTLDFSWNWFRHLFDPIHGYKSFQRLEKLMTLDFSYNPLNNSVLPFFGAARSLRTLDLSVNELEGVFPPNELANMTELRVLNLRRNHFSLFSVQGLINFRELEVLVLSQNIIKDVEAGDGLRRTMKLKTLDLTGNSFSETARLKGLEYLVELKVLSLASSNFNHTGSVGVLKDMPKLQELDLSNNELTDLDSLGVAFPSSLQILNLRYNHLSLTPKGYSEICKLRYLRELNLRFNALTSMPNCLGNLTRLQTLDISENQLNQNLSSFVSGLPPTLEYLSLLDNNFNGSFRFNSLVNYTKLTVFKVSSTLCTIQDLTDSPWIPLFQLKMLILKNFSFHMIPGFLIHQHELQFIDLSHNKLTGAFPTWLVQNNTRLEIIYMNHNSLTELQLPRHVHGLQDFDISSNRISDSLQKDIGVVFPNLRYMNFSSNHFYGTIPYSMGEMKSLNALDISSNGLCGQLPVTLLSDCYSLKVLKLSNNQFHGNVFPEHANLIGLFLLFLDGNRFNGSLGKGLLNSKGLFVLDISDNSISGTLPLWIGRMAHLEHLYMSGNQLKGPFPRQLQNLQSLEVIDISHNSFYGSIPRNVDFPSLRELKLQSNEFMGSIPDTLFKFERLMVLDLRNNKFSRMIINMFGKRSNLRILLLRNNSFESHIPEKICQLSKVGLMDLSHNKFKGVIPSCLGNMSFGVESYGYNVFIGTSFVFTKSVVLLQNWSYTSALDLDEDVIDWDQSTPATIVEFLTKSRYEAYQGDILHYMYGLDLSSNKLSGEIPVELGNLQNIRSLNLSSNRLTGSIPNSISKLKDLESLDLSSNKLYGSIPSELADLNSLGFFSVSCNNLSGEIPFKGHLVTFEEMSYIGNRHLCGLPTNRSCLPIRVPESIASKQAREDESSYVIDMVWFYWTCGAVYISTSLALFAFLCIDSRWSREWFYRVDLVVHHLQRFKDRFVCN